MKHMQRHKGEAGVHVPDLQQYRGAYKEYTNAQGRNYHHKVKDRVVGCWVHFKSCLTMKKPNSKISILCWLCY